MEISAANANLWINNEHTPGFLVPNLSFSWVISDSNNAKWAAATHLMALILLREGVGPVPISPFFVMALLSPPHKFFVSTPLIALFAPKLAELLDPWLRLRWNDPLPTMDHQHPIQQLLIETFGQDVRFFDFVSHAPLLTLYPGYSGGIFSHLS